VSSTKRPRARRDEHGECLHLYLTKDATCVHCGMKFGRVWEAKRAWITHPLRKNLVLGFAAFALVVVGYVSEIPFVAMGFLFVGIFFLIRALLGTAETFMNHRFSPGKLGAIVPRPWYAVTALKPAFAFVGNVKFPMDMEVYSQFNEGETLLIEYFKWSRLPVAIYRGHLPR
jgi:hypothetical protein